MTEKYSRADINIWSTKTNATRVLPIKYSLLPLLRLRNEYDFEDRKPDDFVFVNPETRKKLYRNYIACLLRSICRKQNLRSINPYLIRHQVLTALRDKNINEKIASKYGGHGVGTANRYTHVKDNKVKEIILEQVYNIKEPTLEEKNEIKKLRNEVDEVKEENQKILKQVHQLFSEMEKKVKGLKVQRFQ